MRYLKAIIPLALLAAYAGATHVNNDAARSQDFQHRGAFKKASLSEPTSVFKLFPDQRYFEYREWVGGRVTMDARESSIGGALSVVDGLYGPFDGRVDGIILNGSLLRASTDHRDLVDDQRGTVFDKDPVLAQRAQRLLASACDSIAPRLRAAYDVSAPCPDAQSFK